jgi:lysophospholipase L1-like esterase
MILIQRHARTALALAASLLPIMAFQLGAAEPDRWEEDMVAFEAADRQHPPPTGGIVFIGSSSIRMWDLDHWLPGLNAVNRGFGGSQMADSVRYADRILIPLKPKFVLVYAGDNDINAGKTPEVVLADYKSFVAKVHGALPSTKIAFIAIKPSLKRWNLVETMRKANALVRQAAKSDPNLEYIDVDAPMIGADGKPKAELFADDGLHLNDEGYKLWTSIVKPYLR